MTQGNLFYFLYRWKLILKRLSMYPVLSYCYVLATSIYSFVLRFLRLVEYTLDPNSMIEIVAIMLSFSFRSLARLSTFCHRVIYWWSQYNISLCCTLYILLRTSQIIEWKLHQNFDFLSTVPRLWCFLLQTLL